MKKEYVFLVALYIFASLFCREIYTPNKNNRNYIEDTIKVALYEQEPYYYQDDKGKLTGYYAEYLDILKGKDAFQYEYVKCTFTEALNLLEEGKIDIMLGLTLTPERKDRFEFNQYSIRSERFGLYTKKNIKYGDIYDIDGYTIGLVEGVTNSNWIANFLENKDINVKYLWSQSSTTVKELLDKDVVDLIVDPINTNSNYNLIYDFSLGPVHITANKNKHDLIAKLDELILKRNKENRREIEQLENKYFKINNRGKSENNSNAIIFIILIILAIIVTSYPNIKRNLIQSKIRNRINNNNYLLHYQPIYDPKKNYIVGFEGLIRLKENNKLIYPNKFVSEIEDNDMLFEVSIWILKKVIEDYKVLKNYENLKDNNFYVSMNVSLDEIENKAFIDQAIKMLNSSNIGKNKICLEIIEKVKIENLNKLNESINLLKEAGFIIAIDDFGIEYSNLDVLKKVEFDIIKIDKYFIDDICECEIKQEILNFLSNISRIKNKKLVAEGVEDKLQNNLIKSIENVSIYIQGYFYNKPMEIEMIKNI